MREMPTMTSSAMSARSYSGSAGAGGSSARAGSPMNMMGSPNLANYQLANQTFEYEAALNQTPLKPAQPVVSATPKEKAMSNARRLVKVFIIDPDENVPLEKALLFSGEEKFTDLTDQELFFEVDIKAILDKHNEARTKIRNKAVKEREEFLEPARIRDLRMTVVSIASF